MAATLPHGIFNPGPFNIKEHVLITICANAGAGVAYAIDIYTIQRLFYGQNLGFIGSFLLVMTTQCVGYGMAGFLRPYLVRPAAMVWPANLVNVALFNAFHADEPPHKGPTRLRYFLYVFAIAGLYYLLPGYLFALLTSISWLCYFNKTNQVLHQVASGSSGLGIGAFTLDWPTITGYLGSPLATPFFASVNIFAGMWNIFFFNSSFNMLIFLFTCILKPYLFFLGFILFVWIIIPLAYYSNVWGAQELPILDHSLYGANGTRTSAAALIDSDTKLFSESAFEALGSKIRISTAFAFAYGLGFAGLTAIITHVILYHGKEIKRQFQAARHETHDDIHTKLMAAYPEVPTWWYFSIFVINVALSIFVVEYYPIYLPWWALLLSILMAAVFSLPVGIVQAVTNQQPGLNIITEFVIGFILPGRPIGNKFLFFSFFFSFS